MNITLHIERLVLDGLPIAAGHEHIVRAAVEAELTRLLSEGGLAASLAAGGAVPHIAGAVLGTTEREPTRLGQHIAGAVYAGIGGNQGAK